MPAGAIGPKWAAGSWSNTAWEEYTWQARPSTGQIPTATRYRSGYRVSHVVKMLLAWIGF